MTTNRHLLVQRPDGTSQRLSLAGREVRVGRSTQDNDLSFPEDENLSRRVKRPGLKMKAPAKRST